MYAFQYNLQRFHARVFPWRMHLHIPAVFEKVFLKIHRRPHRARTSKKPRRNDRELFPCNASSIYTLFPVIKKSEGERHTRKREKEKVNIRILHGAYAFRAKMCINAITRRPLSIYLHLSLSLPLFRHKACPHIYTRSRAQWAMYTRSRAGREITRARIDIYHRSCCCCCCYTPSRRYRRISSPLGSHIIERSPSRGEREREREREGRNPSTSFVSPSLAPPPSMSRDRDGRRFNASLELDKKGGGQRGVGGKRRKVKTVKIESEKQKRTGAKTHRWKTRRGGTVPLYSRVRRPDEARGREGMRERERDSEEEKMKLTLSCIYV